MDRAKLIEKIQKCLSLSTSPEPHEAAAALRQAQKLMAKHGVTDAELGLASYTSEKVDVPLQAGKSIPETLATLMSLLQRAFGVRVTIHSEIRVSDASWCVTYYGKTDRVVLAAYTHPIVWRAMSSSWNKFLKDHPHIRGAKGARGSYQVGWLAGVQRQVDDFAMPDAEREELGQYLEQENPGISERSARKTNEAKRYDGGLVRAGLRDSKEFALHRPIGG